MGLACWKRRKRAPRAPTAKVARGNDLLVSVEMAGLRVWLVRGWRRVGAEAGAGAEFFVGDAFALAFAVERENDQVRGRVQAEHSRVDRQVVEQRIPGLAMIDAL